MDIKPARLPLPLDQPAPPAAPETQQPAPADRNTSAGPIDVADLQDRIVEVLRTCYDPEIPVNIYELGLIYSIEAQPAGDVAIRMTLTSPMCPVAGSLPPEVQAKIEALPGVKSVKLDLVWDPPWSQDMMSEAARVQLGFF